MRAIVKRLFERSREEYLIQLLNIEAWMICEFSASRIDKIVLHSGR